MLKTVVVFQSKKKDSYEIDGKEASVIWEIQRKFGYKSQMNGAWLLECSI